MGILCTTWRMCWTCIVSHMIHQSPEFAWMRWAKIWSKTNILLNQPNRGRSRAKTTPTRKKAVTNLFIAYEPLAGKRYLKVTEHRTKKDWALFMQEVLEEQYPEATKVVLVMDNLNTHTPASFYEVLPPEQAKALIDRLEIHYTPKHAILAQYRRDRTECVGAARPGPQHCNC